MSDNRNPGKSGMRKAAFNGVPCCSPFVSNDGIVLQNCEFLVPKNEESSRLRQGATISQERFEVFNEMNKEDLEYFKVIENKQSFVTL